MIDFISGIKAKLFPVSTKAINSITTDKVIRETMPNGEVKVHYKPKFIKSEGSELTENHYVTITATLGEVIILDTLKLSRHFKHKKDRALLRI